MNAVGEREGTDQAVGYIRLCESKSRRSSSFALSFPSAIVDPPTKLQESDANKTSHGPISVAEGARAAERRGEASKQVGVG